MSYNQRYYFETKNRFRETVEYILEDSDYNYADRVYSISAGDVYNDEDTMVAAVKAFRVLFDCHDPVRGWVSRNEILFIPTGLIHLLKKISEIEVARMIALRSVS